MVCVTFSGIMLMYCGVIAESIAYRNAGQHGLSRTSWSQGRYLGVVQLWIVDIEDVGDAV